MRRFSGQAARHTGRALHALAQLAFALVVLAAVALGVLSWRLGQGPLELPWLAQRLMTAVNADLPDHLTVTSAALAWEGFSGGVDQPLDIRVSGLTVTNTAGVQVAAVPRAEVSLSVGWLLLGRLVPRAIAIDGARLRVARAPDGSVALDLGGPASSVDQAPAANADAGALLRELARPAAGDHTAARRSRWSQLDHIRIADATASIVDHQLGVTWRVPLLNVDLRRQAQGGVEGQAAARLAVGDVTATLTATAAFRGDDHRTHIAARLTPVDPAALARQMPAAAALAALDAPVGVSGTADLDPDLAIAHLGLQLDAGAGTLHIGAGTMPLVGATLRAGGTPDAVQVDLAPLQTAPTPDGPRTTVEAHASVARDADGTLRATGSLDLDRVAFADLPALWPEGLGGKGTRPWITQNITDGVARDGHVELALTAPPDLSGVTVTRVTGGIDGHDITVHWLRPVPPIEHVDGRLTVASPDAIDITLSAGRQAGGAQGGLRIDGGRVTISGLNDKDQYADIEGDVSGPVPDLLTLLRNPKVKLLDRSPLKLRDAAGAIAGKLTLARLPLRDDVSFDALQLSAAAKVTGLRLAAIAAGRDLDHGNFTLDVNTDGLHATGNAQVAGIPAQLRIDMDFRAGPPAQVLQKATLAGIVDSGQLRTFGVDPGDILGGSLPVTAAVAIRRDGVGDIVVDANLGQASIRLARLDYSKPAGQAASLSAHIALSGDRIAAVDSLRVDGDGLHIDAAADFVAGQPSVVRLRRVILGNGTDAQGEVRPPARAGDPWRVSLSGSSLDVSSEFAKTTSAPAAPPVPGEPPGPSWVLDARFDRVILGPGRAAGSVLARAENDGRVISRATLSGQTRGGAPFQIAITPQQGGRRLTGTTDDAGGLLRLVDIIDTMQGGRMTLTGAYDDSQPEHPLAGTAEIRDFRIRNAPILAKLLQAMTLYGLVEIARGPGLGFTRLVAPFRLAADSLTLSEARAFSASLGMTAKGRIDLARQVADMRGTIVPAYFFNALLGTIPFVGKLFSPERGGGVFAATYAVRGPLDNPDISINPLAALTPGFLRGVFGLFGNGAGGR